MNSIHLFSRRYFKSARAWLVLPAALAAILLLSGCAATGQMVYQPRFDPLSATTFFADGSSARPAVPNTVSYSADNSANSPINTGLDQNGQPMNPQPVFSWNVSGGGTISASGLFTAGSTAGGAGALPSR